ncbi:MAG: hypothetical protein HYS38_07545 [Acidobacteria bacterium]|nr:hypothetical protein [Acidobacteriota bacterium]
MTGIGIALFSLTVLLILIRYFRAIRPSPFPRHGTAGAAILVAGEALLFAGVEPVATYFTAIAWTGYILWADAAVFSLRGKSLLKSHPAEFAWIAFCSIPLWLIFEAYNLWLRNWVYVGLPGNWLALYFGYAWAFATIWPAILETATLWRALRHPPAASTPRKTVGQIVSAVDPTDPPETKRAASRPAEKHLDPKNQALAATALVGALLLIAPVLVPPWISSYLFGAVWLGFVFLLEPVNFRTGRESLWEDLRGGDFSRLNSLLMAGWICGIFWEFWNYWAQARWVYTVPILPEWRIFAMPVLGYWGFPPFAIECFAILAFLAPGINVVRKKLGAKRPLRWEALQL